MKIDIFHFSQKGKSISKIVQTYFYFLGASSWTWIQASHICLPIAKNVTMLLVSLCSDYRQLATQTTALNSSALQLHSDWVIDNSRRQKTYSHSEPGFTITIILCSKSDILSMQLIPPQYTYRVRWRVNHIYTLRSRKYEIFYSLFSNWFNQLRNTNDESNSLKISFLEFPVQELKHFLNRQLARESLVQCYKI